MIAGDSPEARGVGEIGITGTGAAVANAIFHATGKGYATYPSLPTSSSSKRAPLVVWNPQKCGNAHGAIQQLVNICRAMCGDYRDSEPALKQRNLCSYHV